jgi:thiamine-phosphate pyrophosphorylase
MLPRLYPIIDVDVCRGRSLDPLAVLDAFLAGGARLIQLRDKSSSTGAQLALADEVCARVRAAGGQFVINDRPDVARMCGADGVHVGQDDMTVADARLVVGPEAIVGVSTHDEAQLEAAARTSATYIAVGPIYGTATKNTGYSARGLALVAHAAERLRSTGDAAPRPVVAIGGITLDRCAEVIQAGAASVAVISDLLAADPAARVRAFRDRLDRAAAGR